MGETLIDETRIWATWADVLGVPRLTFMALLGAVIARGGEHHDAFAALGVDDWRSLAPAVDAAFGRFREADLYPDARTVVPGLRDRGYRVAIVANQPASRGAELRALGIDAEVMAMSEELGVAKPDPAFFARALALMGSPNPADVAYVGDRIDNDVVPATAAGMRAVWLRRGPWAAIQAAHLADDGPATLTVRSLTELANRIHGAFRTRR